MVINRIISMALILVLVFTLPFYFGVYTKVIFIVALAVLLFSETLKRKTLYLIWQEVALGLLFTLAIIYIVLDKSFSPISEGTLIFYYAIPFLMLLYIRRVWKENYEWLLLGYSYLAGCFVSATIMIVSWSTGGLTGFGTIGSAQRFSVGELNINYVSYSLVTGVAIGLILILFEKIKFRIKVLVVVVAVLSLGVLLSGTRGSLISIVFLLLSYYSFQLWRRPIKFLLILITTVALGMFLLNIVPEELSSRILSQPEGGGDVSNGRYSLWAHGVSFISESPLLGNGIGFFEAYNSSGTRLHNAFLAVLVEFGVIGFLLYASVIFSILLTKDKSSESIRARILFIVSWLPIAMTGVWEFSIPAWFFYAWLSRMPVKFNIYST